MNRVLDPRAMANDLIAARGPTGACARSPPQGSRSPAETRPRTGSPASRVDLVVSSREHARSPSPAADWRSRPAARPAARTAREPARPHGGAGRFNDPFVGRMQLPAQPFKGGPGHVDPAEAAEPAVLPNHRRAEGSLDIDANPSSSAPPVRSHAGAMADTTPTDSRFPAQPGKSQRRPATHSSSRLIG